LCDLIQFHLYFIFSDDQKPHRLAKIADIMSQLECEACGSWIFCRTKCGLSFAT